MTFWESFCRTYFEMNGYFVNANLFAALIQPDDLLPAFTADDAECKGQDAGHLEHLKEDLTTMFKNFSLNCQ